MKVLIVDDSIDAARVAKARLAGESLDIVCADGGRDGLEKARSENPDLILLDVDMPDINGFDVCRALKADPDLCMIPIIFLSGSTGPEDKVKGLDLGAVDYVTKPFDGFEIRARVRAALRTKRTQDLLIKYAQIDPLTELAHHRALVERIQAEWSKIQRYGGSLAFIMGDLDNFKQINDTFGHQAGDRVLCEVAKVLSDKCREPDMLARYGGEEFSILCPNVDAMGAGKLAERCRRKIEDICIPAGRQIVRITASFGVADSSLASSYQTLIDVADKAMYQAKQQGRNRIVVANESISCTEPAISN